MHAQLLITLHEQDLLLSHRCQHRQHGPPLGLIRRPLELPLELLNFCFEPLKLVRGLHSTTARAIRWVNRSINAHEQNARAHVYINAFGCESPMLRNPSKFAYIDQISPSANGCTN